MSLYDLSFGIPPRSQQRALLLRTISGVVVCFCDELCSLSETCLGSDDGRAAGQREARLSCHSGESGTCRRLSLVPLIRVARAACWPVPPRLFHRPTST